MTSPGRIFLGSAVMSSSWVSLIPRHLTTLCSLRSAPSPNWSTSRSAPSTSLLSSSACSPDSQRLNTQMGTGETPRCWADRAATPLAHLSAVFGCQVNIGAPTNLYVCNAFLRPMQKKEPHQAKGGVPGQSASSNRHGQAASPERPRTERSTHPQHLLLTLPGPK